MSYPKLIARFDDKHPADEVLCTRCKVRVKWDPADGDPLDRCQRHYVIGKPWDHPDQCGGELSYRWAEGSTCVNCGKLDWSMPDGLGGACSRRCQLQAEYAAELARLDRTQAPSQRTQAPASPPVASGVASDG